jgi:protein-S-isoprenylcysteine O-methyltransferase Ste14
MRILSSQSRARQLFFANVLKKGTKLYDLAAAAPLLAWYGVSAGSLLRPLVAKASQFFVQPNAALGLVILSRSAVLLFAFIAICMLLMRSPPTAGAKGIGPRIAAVLGTYITVGVVLFLPAMPVPGWALALSSALVLGGMGFSLYAILFLGRSFSLVAEARSLVMGGPYAHIRHPLYVGEELAIFGSIIQYISPFALALLALQIVCQIYRMGCEEAVLEETFSDYGTYKARTARLIPGLY